MSNATPLIEIFCTTGVYVDGKLIATVTKEQRPELRFIKGVPFVAIMGPKTATPSREVTCFPLSNVASFQFDPEQFDK